MLDWALAGAREEGEQRGLAKGKSAGKIQILQELLGEPATAEGELQSLSVDTLTAHLAELQQQLRDRQA